MARFAAVGPLASFWYWHPLSTGHGTTCSRIDHTGCGYSLWSGFIGDLGLVTIFVSMTVFLFAWWRKHNCHVHRCWRLQWHVHPEHGHPVCPVHHPNGHRGMWWRLLHWCKLPADHFLDASNHHYNHHSSAARIAATPPFGGFNITTTAPGGVDVVVGPVEPEKPKRQRTPKPGTKPVTDISSKQKD